ncbi:MAG: hypothetical protein J5585_06015 [Clostridia bacterium]|nr:hypothetical protein [Clostridia bacterium]
MKKLTSILLSVIMVASLFAGVITINAEDEALDTPEKIVTALYALDKGATLAGGPYTLSGKVTSVVEKYTTEYNNVSVMMSLPGLADYPVEAFRIVGEGIDKIDVGYTITVTGELTHYYNKNKDESIFEFKKNSTLDYYTPIKNVSYDRLSYDGVLVVPEGSVDKKVVDPANADAINFNKGSVTTATIRGWVEISEDPADIQEFGYKIDGGDLVTGNFIEDRGTELANAGFPGAKGFQINIPVKDLAEGSHTISTFVIDKDGIVYEMLKNRTTKNAILFNPLGVTFTVLPEGQTQPTDYYDGFGDDHVAADWLTNGRVEGGVLTLGLPRSEGWIATGYIAYLTSRKVNYADNLEIKFKASFLKEGSCYAGFALRAANGGNHMNGGRWGKPDAAETADGIAIDMNVAGADYYVGVTFSHGAQGSAPCTYFGGGVNVGELHEYKIEDRRDEIKVYIDDALLFTIALSELSDGLYHHAVVTYKDGSVSFDGAVEVNEVGYMGFYQRDMGVTVDEITVKTLVDEPEVEFAQHVSADQVQADDGSDLAKFGGNAPAGTPLGDITGKTTKIKLFGWYASTESIVDFGYRYEGEEPVFGYGKYTTGQDVINAGNSLVPHCKEASRFSIDQIPLKDGRDVTLYAVVKLENGEIIDMWKVTYTNNVDHYLRHMFDKLMVGGENIKKADSGKMKPGEEITILGWVAFDDGLKEIYYTVDGEKKSCDDNYRDRPDLVLESTLEVYPELAYIYNNGAHAGFGKDDAYMKLVGTGALAAGKYKIEIIAVSNSGEEALLKAFDLEVGGESAAGKSWDWIAVSGAILTAAGNCDQYIVDNPVTAYKDHAVPSSDVLGVLGWASLKDAAAISGFAYSLDDGALVKEPAGAEAFEHFFWDRDAELAAAGIVGGKGYWIVFPFSGLEPGEHVAHIYVLDPDGVETLLYDFPFTIGEPDWLCDPSYRSTGWWHNPLDGTNTFTTNVTFTTDKGFKGIRGYYYFNNAAAGAGTSSTTTTLKLLDSEGNILETKSITGGGDAFYNTMFSKTYAAGTYTLQYTTGGDNNGWFVLASGNDNGKTVSVSGGGTNGNTCPNPYIGLFTAVLGDVDGDGELSNKDVVLLFRAVSNGIKKGEVYLAENADVNGDGSVDNLDVVDLFKMVTKGA